MFVIRQANPDDHTTIIQLARMQHFASLRADADDVIRLIAQSRDSFADRAASQRERRFLFVLEDTDTGAVVGMSSVRASRSPICGSTSSSCTAKTCRPVTST